MNTKVSKYFDQKQAEEYEARRGKTQAWHAEIEVFNEIKNRIAAKYNKNMDVLDVGAGTGRWMLDLNDVASKYVVTDISENMLVQAKQKLKSCSEEFKKNTQIIKSSVEQLPLHVNGKFDFIIMTRFLSYFSNISHDMSGGANTLSRAKFNQDSTSKFVTNHASSLRAIFDFSSPEDSLFIISTGQSEHILSRHYDDLSELWRRGQYIPMTMDSELVRSGSAGTMKFSPSAN